MFALDAPRPSPGRILWRLIFSFIIRRFVFSLGGRHSLGVLLSRFRVSYPIDLPQSPPCLPCQRVSSFSAFFVLFPPLPPGLILSFSTSLLSDDRLAVAHFLLPPCGQTLPDCPSAPQKLLSLCTSLLTSLPSSPLSCPIRFPPLSP